MGSGPDSPSPRAAAGRRQRRHRHERARAELIRSALRLAADAPFRDLAVERIAAGAEISRSAFYLHFSDKNELLLAALDGVSGELDRLASEWWKGDGPPAELVRDAVSSFVSVYADNADLLRLVTEVAAYDEDVREQWLGLVEGATESTAGHIRREQRAGLISRTVDSGATSEALIWMAERCCDVYLRRGGRSPEEVVEALTPVWTAALYPGVIPAEQLRPDPRAPGGPWGGPQTAWPAWEHPERVEGKDRRPDDDEAARGTGADS